MDTCNTLELELSDTLYARLLNNKRIWDTCLSINDVVMKQSLTPAVAGKEGWHINVCKLLPCLLYWAKSTVQRRLYIQLYTLNNLPWYCWIWLQLLNKYSRIWDVRQQKIVPFWSLSPVSFTKLLNNKHSDMPTKKNNLHASFVHRGNN